MIRKSAGWSRVKCYNTKQRQVGRKLADEGLQEMKLPPIVSKEQEQYEKDYWEDVRNGLFDRDTEDDWLFQDYLSDLEYYAQRDAEEYELARQDEQDRRDMEWMLEPFVFED